MATMRESTRIAFENNDCPEPPRGCGAKAGQPCRGKNGAVMNAHAGWIHFARRENSNASSSAG